ncbi:chemotaxis protein CheB [Sphingomonas rubra]|uniref:protein-glutamate methylesterase n=1 Tax=Sphingomonas rubra TaxID=634430 RepID=A0A1I5SYA6_9SPHN|nr:chemotaxis protein CheB [Sphingomonas rubra]SFP75196.1 two-component system, chemotaxis family, response regulator CheB [Sphingomonas rubra]
MPSAAPIPFDPAVAGVLVVDDSVVARAVLARLVDDSARFRTVGAVGSVAAALDFLSRTRVDFILLDVVLPRVDGLTALPELIAAAGDAKIIVVAGSTADGAKNSVRALALGAADTLVKPDVAAMSGRFGAQLIERLERLSARTPDGASRCGKGRAAAVTLPAIGDYDVVAIGASTGGIHALGLLLRALPAGFRSPILVTQHLPASFMPYFAAQLAVLAGRPCEVAAHRLRIRPGRVIVAPGDAHLQCVSIGDHEAAIRLTTAPAASGCLPSVDPMFASVAEVYGARALAVVLSGMGRDGADGARRVHEAGGTVIVQDQASSVVWGMPAAIVSQGFEAATLPPEALGRLIATGRRP